MYFLLCNVFHSSLLFFLCSGVKQSFISKQTCCKSLTSRQLLATNLRKDNTRLKYAMQTRPTRPSFTTIKSKQQIYYLMCLKIYFTYFLESLVSINNHKHCQQGRKLQWRCSPLCGLTFQTKLYQISLLQATLSNIVNFCDRTVDVPQLLGHYQLLKLRTAYNLEFKLLHFFMNRFSCAYCLFHIFSIRFNQKILFPIMMESYV